MAETTHGDGSPTPENVAGLIEHVSLRGGITAELVDGQLVMIDDHVQSRVSVSDPAMAAVAQALIDGGSDEDSLFVLALEHGGADAAMPLSLMMRRLEAGGWLRFSVRNTAGYEVVAVEPRGHQSTPLSRRAAASSVLLVDEHAITRWQDGVVLAESPHSNFDLVIADVSYLTVLFSFGAGTSVDNVAASHGLDTASLALVASAALRCGALRFADQQSPEGSGLWNLPDLWFHTMSRVGIHRGGYGGTYHLENVLEPEPAVRPPFGELIAFDPLDPATVGHDDPPFGDVVRARASVRAHDDNQPITSTQLGELLGRVGLVREVLHDGHQELSFRQVPSGGAAHELEIYPLVHSCFGLDAGLYHYDAGRHGLELIRPADPHTRLLLEYSQRTSIMDSPPQVTLLIAARFARAMWKYESMAYALILKHVGVMYEALYLTSTAMGLACCGLGGGNAQAFASASGLPALVEGSVGEFVVGSRSQTLVDDSPLAFTTSRLPNKRIE
ncbi:MAG: SagB-type dehydrogenase family enzyme [Minisyncoccia bacterium]|jgi:SagB-type dehydrogenase family enzyme